MAHATSVVVKTVIKLYGLVPVVHAWGIVETVVACGLGGVLHVGVLLAMIQVEIRAEALAWAIVEIVLRRESLLGVVVLSQIVHTLGLADGLILTCHVVGHKVDDDLKTCLVGAGYQCIELAHTLVYIYGQIGVDIVIVGDGIRRACPTLDHSRMLAGNAIGGVIGHGGVADDACVP